MDDGAIWAWPMLLLDHNQAFATFSYLRDYRARWRQWEPGGRVDFDAGASDEDKAAVERWIARASLDRFPNDG